MEQLLKNDGVVFISVDDREVFYLKIVCDEIFGSNNFLNDIIWNSTKSVTNTAIISVSHTHNLVYFKNKEFYIKNRTMFRLEEDGKGFANPDNDPRGPWKADPFQVGGWRPNQQYEIVNPKTGKVYRPNEGCSWKNDYQKFQELLADNRIVFGVNGVAGPQRKRFLYEARERGKVAKTIWDDVGTTRNGTQHLKKLFGRIVFPVMNEMAQFADAEILTDKAFKILDVLKKSKRFCLVIFYGATHFPYSPPCRRRARVQMPSAPSPCSPRLRVGTEPNTRLLGPCRAGL